MVERMLMYYGEGLVDRDILPRGYHAFGVLDDDPPILGVVNCRGEPDRGGRATAALARADRGPPRRHSLSPSDTVGFAAATAAGRRGRWRGWPTPGSARSAMSALTMGS